MCNIHVPYTSYTGPPLDCAHRACIKCDAVLKWKCCPPCRKLLEQSAQPPPTQQPPSPQQQQEQGQPPLPPQQQAPQQNASYDPSAAMDYDDSPVYPTSTATNSGHTQSASATSAPPSHPNDRSPHNTATAPATHPQQQTNVYSSTEWGHAPPPSMPPHQAGQPPAPVGWSAPPSTPQMNAHVHTHQQGAPLQNNSYQYAMDVFSGGEIQGKEVWVGGREEGREGERRRERV